MSRPDPELVKSGSIAKLTLAQIKETIKPGVTGKQLDQLVAELLVKNNATASFLGFHGYEAHICVSVNNEVVHGIPDDWPFKVGDVVTIDLGVTYHDWIVDCARTWEVTANGVKTNKLIDTAQLALDRAIKLAVAGTTTGSLGAIIESTITKEGYSIVKDLTGHGVNPTLQEPPQIANYGVANQGPKLKAGQIIAIEPIITDKPSKIWLDRDNWTILAQEGVLAVQVEDTVWVGEHESQILTR